MASAADTASSTSGPRHVVVLDSGPIINGSKIDTLGSEFYTVEEVMAEIRDKKARHLLETIPVELKSRQVPPEAMNFVARFAEKTGDLRSLSATDCKVIALTLTLHRELLGMEGIRSEPKEIKVPSSNDAEPKKKERTFNPTEQVDLDELDDGDISDDEEHEVAAATTTEEQHEVDEGGDDEDDDDDGFQPAHGAKKEIKKKKEPKKETLIGWFDGAEDDEETGWITEDTMPESLTTTIDEDLTNDNTTSVAVVTTDYAMQNVILQMGLKLISVDGLRISTVKQFVLKCHACFKICADITKTFCPSCGNNTLMKVSKTVGSDGSVYYSKGVKHFNLRGTQYSIPLPKGGRRNTDLILREDQIPNRRKKNKDDDIFDLANVFAASMSTKSQSNVIVGYGRKNPNERRRKR